MEILIEKKSVPIQEAVDIIQADIDDVHTELEDAGKLVGKITALGILAIVLIGSVMYYQNTRIKELEQKLKIKDNS